MSKLKIFTDGGARGNPGPAAIGVFIEIEKQGKKETKKFKKFLGERTNNQAEYEAVIFALTQAKKLQAEEIEFFLDSELIANQLNLKFKVKDQDLGILFVRAWNLVQSFKKVTFQYIPREKNQEADLLVNQALDQEEKKKKS